MTIKLVLLKSGEDIIADVGEMSVGEDDNARLVGYYLNKPCVVKMVKPTLLTEEEGSRNKKSGFEVSLFPWIPLTQEKTIPVPTDWVITIVEPTEQLKQMYIEDVVNYEQSNQNNTLNE